jgi:hypothetical protein
MRQANGGNMNRNDRIEALEQAVAAYTFKSALVGDLVIAYRKALGADETMTLKEAGRDLVEATGSRGTRGGGQ